MATSRGPFHNRFSQQFPFFLLFGVVTKFVRHNGSFIVEKTNWGRLSTNSLQTKDGWHSKTQLSLSSIATATGLLKKLTPRTTSNMSSPVAKSVPVSIPSQIPSCDCDVSFSAPTLSDTSTLPCDDIQSFMCTDIYNNTAEHQSDADPSYGHERNVALNMSSSHFPNAKRKTFFILTRKLIMDTWRSVLWLFESKPENEDVLELLDAKLRQRGCRVRSPDERELKKKDSDIKVFPRSNKKIKS